MTSPAPNQPPPDAYPLVGPDVAVLLECFTTTANRWQLTTAERCRLLGDLPVETVVAWTTGSPPDALPPEQYLRIGHVIGIEVALCGLYGVEAEHVRAHLRRPATAPSGEGTALDHMLTGLAGLETVRAHLQFLAVWGAP